MKNNFINEMKAYLETLNHDMTVNEVLNNINKAYTMKLESIDKLKSEMEKNVGKVYLIKDEDTYLHVDDENSPVVLYRSYIKITGTTTIGAKESVLYRVDEYEICDDHVLHMEDTTISQDDLKNAIEIGDAVFDCIESMFNEIIEQY